MLLARNDVDVIATIQDCQTPLSWAAENRHEAVVKILLERNDVDINATDHSQLRRSPWYKPRSTILSPVVKPNVK
jgi:ankyrin repeat protein